MISLKEIKDRKAFEEGLRKRGWKEGRFNGRACMIKELESWLWICLVFDHEAKFASFALEDSSKIHSEGVKRLLEEIKNLSEEFDFAMFGRLEYGG